MRGTTRGEPATRIALPGGQSLPCATAALNQRIVRVTQLLEQMRNTEMAFGSDAMVAAL